MNLEGGRLNQKRRTRKALLEAASQLMKAGRKPTLEEAAEAALVSRATAYRYFPNVEALLLEAGLDLAVKASVELFGPDAPSDPVARVERVDEMFHDMILENETALRLMIANALQRLAGGEETDVLARQNRRSPLIEAALEPAREDLDPRLARQLVAALGLIIGSEGFIAGKDVLQLSDAELRQVKRWAIGALIDAARRPT